MSAIVHKKYKICEYFQVAISQIRCKLPIVPLTINYIFTEVCTSFAFLPAELLKTIVFFFFFSKFGYDAIMLQGCKFELFKAGLYQLTKLKTFVIFSSSHSLMTGLPKDMGWACNQSSQSIGRNRAQ